MAFPEDPRSQYIVTPSLEVLVVRKRAKIVKLVFPPSVAPSLRVRYDELEKFHAIPRLVGFCDTVPVFVKMRRDTHSIGCAPLTATSAAMGLFVCGCSVHGDVR